MNNVEHYSKLTGEELSSEVVEEIIKEVTSNKVKLAFLKLREDENLLTLEEIEMLRRLKSKTGKVKLNFKSSGYIIQKRNLNNILKLNDYTKAFLYSMSHMITHDGRLKYENNRMIPSFAKLKDFLGIKNNKWNTHIKPDIEKFKILTKEKIDNKWCLLLNPIYATTTREVTETMFIAFHSELREYLDALDYLYLKRLYSIEVD